MSTKHKLVEKKNAGNWVCILFDKVLKTNLVQKRPKITIRKI